MASEVKMEDVVRPAASLAQATGLSSHARRRGRYPGYTRDRLAGFAHRLERRIWPDQAPAGLIEIAVADRPHLS